MQDSWVYTNLNTAFISCKIAGGHKVVSGDCSNRLSIQSPPAGNCKGCIDSHVIFNDIYSGLPRGSLASDLNTRYVLCLSTNFSTYMGNVWDNYYFVKIPSLQLISGRITNAINSLNIVVSDLTSISTLFSNVVTSLDATLSGIVDPKYGLIAGLNCLLIGEDINDLLNTLCVSNFNTIYLTRLVMGIPSFGILFALCCIICSGRRHQKQF
jgi:hypothetical protein